MRCSDYEPIILFMARTTSLKDDRAGQQALAHTKDCNRCAARLAEEEALVAGVRAVVADLAKEQAPARLEETLLTAFRQRGRARGSGLALVPLTRMSRRTQWVLATAAAVIVVGASAIAFLRNQSDQFTRPREAPAIQNERRAGPAAVPDRAKAATGPGQVARAHGAQTVARKPSRRQRKTRTSYAETTTDYFALTDEDDLRSLDSAKVVRVELATSALTEIGLWADPDMDGETVKADILLGQDGRARAIRFVR